MLKLTNISKRWEGFTLKDITLTVGKGDYFILLGPSGAGKSVLLEVIAGLIAPDGGDITLNDANITHLKIQERDIGLVFQDLALFPHLNVHHNIGYPLYRKGYKSREVNRRVVELAQELGISHLLKRFPPTLSGGEQQRVALARTLALNPSLLLLDEPLSSLDVERKVEIRRLLRDLNRKGQTIVHVTHDYEEAIALGNRIAIINNGAIEQIGSPQEVFGKPTSSFVAGFGGVRNFFKISISKSEDSKFMKARVNENLSFYLQSDDEGNGYAMIPENEIVITHDKPGTETLNTFPGTVIDIYPHRFGCEVVVDIGEKIFAIMASTQLQAIHASIGSKVWVSFQENSTIFIKSS
ncbi:MAG TPA: ABC transporter ATP-binding protein [Tenuifilaceae bacterium]|jgi:ABC-type sugar transport system ATPase subunit|nr:ABC transporter ATP-binding protein [Bacteroidales bacterium]MDI9515651.1 ABC transporter ATP-binding protein [Bacteroidota bacterium]OQC63262.1 MAG: sn-glycerol-3-phosphate import ATP-binding protein UgpC [Bacteroidetes bacterium ADurb.Bin008]HNV81258.1 ABC transporter ATP-binding protein [Tenuifilaceae bacterium]MZP82682.1 ATP-binding cassette domain-containing protein [Bacteroidales bacterium]